MKKLMCVVVALLTASCIFANADYNCTNEYDFDKLMSAIEFQREKYYDIILRYDESCVLLTHDSVEEIFKHFDCCDAHRQQVDNFFQEQYDGRCMDSCNEYEEILQLMR